MSCAISSCSCLRSSGVGRFSWWILAAIACPAALAAQSPAAYVVDTLAAGVYAIVSGDGLSEPVHGNSLLVTGTSSALLVDAGRTIDGATRLASLVRELTDRPLRYLVNTHWHQDHTLGNATIAREFKGITILGHEATREAIERERLDFDTFVDGERNQQSRYDEIARTGRLSSGATLTEEQSRRVEGLRRMMSYVLASDTLVDWVAPDIGMDGRLSLGLGGRSVNLIAFGHGNTEGDLAILVPDAQVLATGDLVVYPIPYGSGSFPREWVTELNVLADSLAFATMVPGHGPVFRGNGREYARVVRDLLRQVIDSTDVWIEEGLSGDSAQQRSRVWNPRFGDDASASDRYLGSFFVRPVVRRLYELEGR